MHPLMVLNPLLVLSSERRRQLASFALALCACHPACHAGGFGSLSSAVSSGGKSLSNAGGSFSKTVKQGAGSATKAVKQGAGSATKTVKKSTQSLGNTVKDTGSTVRTGVKGATSGAKSGFSYLSDHAKLPKWNASSSTLRKQGAQTAGAFVLGGGAGANVGAVNLANNVLGPNERTTLRKTYQGAGKGAATGGAMGAVTGPGAIIGAAGGAVSGAITGFGEGVNETNPGYFPARDPTSAKNYNKVFKGQSWIPKTQTGRQNVQTGLAFAVGGPYVGAAVGGINAANRYMGPNERTTLRKTYQKGIASAAASAAGSAIVGNVMPDKMTDYRVVQKTPWDNYSIGGRPVASSTVLKAVGSDTAKGGAFGAAMGFGEGLYKANESSIHPKRQHREQHGGSAPTQTQSHPQRQNPPVSSGHALNAPSHLSLPQGMVSRPPQQRWRPQTQSQPFHGPVDHAHLGNFGFAPQGGIQRQRIYRAFR